MRLGGTWPTCHVELGIQLTTAGGVI
ncbi:hypothetical protein Pint_02866 [Pistacia integerrima]|uniref:Uncharacterized protein n=1 Tax=Pistacia integerrima TaxID=434235 RepID=A0ACC0ZEX9_9ROSI|nr:hypothetical protein Pint_02866 [Pistacia integerrima]